MTVQFIYKQKKVTLFAFNVHLLWSERQNSQYKENIWQKKRKKACVNLKKRDIS